MRNEIFQQIQNSRENYYREIGNHSASDNNTRFGVKIIRFTIPKIKVQTFPNFSLRIPNAGLTTMIRLFSRAKSLIINIAGVLGRYVQMQLAPLQSGIVAWNERFESKSEALKEQFYNRVLTLFDEDDADRKSNSAENVDQRFSNWTSTENNLPQWIRKTWAHFLISFELDAATNEIVLIHKVQEIIHGTQSKENRIKSFFRKSTLIWRLKIKQFPKKMKRYSLQPIINRFIL